MGHEVESTTRKTAIVQLRKSLHVSQARLAQAVSLSQSSISAWEQGYSELPRSDRHRDGRLPDGRAGEVGGHSVPEDAIMLDAASASCEKLGRLLAQFNTAVEELRGRIEKLEIQYTCGGGE